MILLNKNQKRYLFDKHYITAKVLDSLVYENWEDFWINNFDFSLDTRPNKYRMYTLKLISKDITIGVNLIFQDNDLEDLLKM